VASLFINELRDQQVTDNSVTSQTIHEVTMTSQLLSPSCRTSALRQSTSKSFILTACSFLCVELNQSSYVV